ncbi:MAG: GNAT family N-acetyltransferase [Myxococcota bacterium]
MTEDSNPIAIREVELAELEPGGLLHGPFAALHREWIARGFSRWLSFVRHDGPHPTVVFGAFVHGQLAGAVVGIWGPGPIPRFDLLFEHAYGPATSRPRRGAWHLIAVTTDPASEVRGLGLGRALLGRALAWASAQGFDVVRTLSPAVGLAELAARWPRDRHDAITTASRPDGRPALQVLRLHLGGGAILERVLSASRRDDLASAQVTLRFLYETAPLARARRRDAWQAWCDERAAAIASGRAELVAPGLYRVTTEADATFVHPDPAARGPG